MTMRFMMMIKADKNTEAGVLPSKELVAAMDKGDTTMRFMMLMIPSGYEKAQAGAMPSAEMVAKMAKDNEALTKAGGLLALDGLHPSSMGTRGSFSGRKP